LTVVGDGDSGVSMGKVEVKEITCCCAEGNGKLAGTY
jgi:hypothetical protein